MSSGYIYVLRGAASSSSSRARSCQYMYVFTILYSLACPSSSTSSSPVAHIFISRSLSSTPDFPPMGDPSSLRRIFRPTKDPALLHSCCTPLRDWGAQQAIQRTPASSTPRHTDRWGHNNLAKATREREAHQCGSFSLVTFATIQFSRCETNVKMALGRIPWRCSRLGPLFLWPSTGEHKEGKEKNKRPKRSLDENNLKDTLVGGTVRFGEEVALQVHYDKNMDENPSE